MSIEELTCIEEEFARHLQIIRQNSSDLPKAQVLRISAWLKKLCSVIDNYFWRKNRNLHAQVLAIMLAQGKLEAPFDKFPPEGSLPKLNLYEIPYSVRVQLESHRTKHEGKQNLPIRNNAEVEKMQTNNPRMHKKQSFHMKSLFSLNADSSVSQSFEDFPSEIQTVRKQDTKNSEIPSQYSKKQQFLIDTMQQALKFLAKKNHKFSKSFEYKNLLQQIVEFGDSTGRDFRQLKFSIIND